MNAKDFIDIRLGIITIPNPFGINHHHRPVFAPVQATGGVDAMAGHAQFLGPRLHIIA
jgi:hypothetical protein